MAGHPPALVNGSRDEINLEASVYAHGLHGAGFHDVVQGHIPSHQGSWGLQAGRGQQQETLPGLALSVPEGNGAWFKVSKSGSKSNLHDYASFHLSEGSFPAFGTHSQPCCENTLWYQALSAYLMSHGSRTPQPFLTRTPFPGMQGCRLPRCWEEQIGNGCA